MKKKYVRLTFLGFLLFFVFLQFIPVHRQAPDVVPEENFVNIYSTPPEIRMILKEACDDCHTHESKYPWYAYVAPLSMWIQGHIDEGKEHFNLSEWSKYDADRADHKLEEAVEMVAEGDMPLRTYTWGHARARLTEAQRQMLSRYFEELRQ